MHVTRFLSLPLLAGAIALTALAIGCNSGDSKPEPTPQAQSASTETATSSPTSTATPSPTNTPSPTPTPFNGAVARMRVPGLGIDYPIENLGLIPGQNQLDTPHNATGAIGWYHIYPKPGFKENAIFSAHVNYNGANGPFARLAQATANDQVVVVMENGLEYTYQVFAVHGYVIDSRYATASRPLIDMGKIIDAPDKTEGDEWVTLITCSCGPGRVLDPDGDGFGECLDRDVVIAKRIT